MASYPRTNIVNLDLSKQRLFIHPDSPLPKFNPRPKAVMVTPIYDYDGPIPSPPTSPADEDAREALYTYGFNVAHDAMNNRDNYRPTNRLHRRYSSHSPPRSDRRGRSRRRHSPIQYSSSAYPSSQAQPLYPSSGDHRSRPSNDPLAQNPPNYQVQATGGGSQGYPGSHSGGGGQPSTAHGRHHRSRPPNDPLAQNPPDYQTQATGGGSQGYPGSHSGGQPPHSAPVHVPSYSGSYSGSNYGGHGRDPPHSAHPSYAGSNHHSHHPTSHYGNAHHVTHNAILPASHSHAPAALHSSKFPLPGVLKSKLETRHAKNKSKFDSFVQAYLSELPLDPEFCLSRCTGGKRAVCIGINYVGQRNELKGCANDARAMRDWLIKHYHFPPSSILLLTDDDRSNKLPTRRAIFEACMWLVQGAKKDDSLFFHYSGHGGQAEDASGRENDGLDEVIFPVDFQAEGDIIDDELHDALVRPLPAGCRLTGIFDSCHSGTILDLPYLHSAHGRLRSMSHISRRARERGCAPKGDVICFSACRDDEKSTDTFKEGVAVGAMSHALLEALRSNPHQTYDELLSHLREILIPKYGQKAQISGSHPLDLDERFSL